MRIPSIIPRLVGLWILVGATLKLLYGTPLDLPEAMRSLPLGLGLTFRIVIATEFVVGLLVLLRPAQGWLPAALLLATFLSVLVTQIAAGDKSCGCFGDAITISPIVMLVVDGVCVLLLLLARPWRSKHRGPQARWLLVLLLCIGAAALPWIFNREAGSATPFYSGRPWTDLKVETYQGRPFKDTVLYGLLPEELRLENGLYVIWSPTCEVCGEHLDALYYTEQAGEREVVLIRSILGGEEPPEEEVKVHVLPKEEWEWVRHFQVPPNIDWSATPPVHIEIKNGMVDVCVSGMDVFDR